MGGLSDGIHNFINHYLYWLVPTTINATDIAEILIITFLLYELLAWIKKTRAWILFRGLLFVFVFVFVATLLQMNTILFVFKNLVSFGFIALVVLFQPELRNALDHLGRKNILYEFFHFGSPEEEERQMAARAAEEVAESCRQMGREKVGALIVFENSVPLRDYIYTGISVDAAITRQLIRNIFEKNTPLHDGAMIISNYKIAAATCYLPLSENRDIDKDYGTRHRAAVGMSEVSDALIVVVSEETGRLSIAQDGELDADLSADEIRERIVAFYGKEIETNETDRKWWKRRSKHEEVSDDAET